jgi:GNAT superfamily N-acetyltransferase
MKKTGEELEKVVYGFWANRFGCNPEDFSKAGTLFIKDKEITDSGTVILYHVYKMSIVRISPSTAKQIGIQDKLVEALTAQRIQSLFGDGYRISVTSTLFDSYLDPKDFRFFSTEENFPARQLDSEKDNSILFDLYEASTEEDLDAADINVDDPDPVIFGLFDEDKMVAYASHRYWGESIADMGVLIHPAYRGQGLGKAVVSALCAWCIQNEVVPMYRVFSNHEHSRKIPLALGFKDMIVIESLKVLGEQSTA